MADYGTTTADVQPHLPHFVIGEATKPSAGDVAGFIATISNWVGSRTRGAIADDDLDTLGWAKGIVALGAAAMTEDARFPERAGLATTEYGAVLWDRFRTALDELLEGLGLDTEPGGGGTIDVTPDSPSFAFPLPLFVRNQGF